MRERSKRDHVGFEGWIDKGYVNKTSGNCMDFDTVESEIYRIASIYDLKILGVDPYLPRMMTQHLMSKTNK